MPERETVKRAQRAKRQGKSPSSQAGEFVREEFHHIREGKHGARSPEQAIAIGLSKARRSGVRMPAPKRGQASPETRHQAEQDIRKGQRDGHHRTSATRSRAVRRALKREGHSAATPRAIGEHSRKAAMRRSPSQRHASALKAVHSRSHEERIRSARKGARTRARSR